MTRKRIKIDTPSDARRSRRAVGRPREFDGVRALLAARVVFARKGLAATTLVDLTEAMGIGRPSLYGAFGDKESLYLKVVDSYAAETGAKLMKELDAHLDLGQALMRFYGAAVDSYVAERQSPVGCLIVCTAVPEAAVNARIRKRTLEILHDIDAALERRIRRAMEERQLPHAAHPSSLAAIAGAMLHSLAVRARAGARRTTLDAMAANLVQLIISSIPSPSTRSPITY